MKSQPLKLTIVARAGNPHIAYLRGHIKKAHSLLRPALREFSIALVGELRMAKLHQDFMGVAGPTDVLTFELDHDARGRVISGEVVICTSVAAREARRRKTSARREMLLYALHGMLHLCGMDDRTARGFAAMHAKEDEILTALGVGAVFEPLANRTHRSQSRKG